MTNAKKPNPGQFKPGHIISEEQRKLSSQLQSGNQYAKKLSTLELKKEAFAQYLAHLSKGKSKKSWWFDHPDLTLTWETMDKYIRDEPDIFDPLQIVQAKSKGYQIWEQVVEDSARGDNKDANTASLQMLMRNKFGWDKEDHSNKQSNETLVEKFLNILDKSENRAIKENE
jgi:hypothetical protein